MISTKIGNDNDVKNEKMFITTIPSVTPNDRTLVGSTSTVQMNESDKIPNPETRITNAKQVTGIQLNIVKSNPSEWQYKYVAMMNRPHVHPANETIRRNFLPCVSTNFAAKMVPTIWTVAKMIDDAFVDKCVPDLSKIVEAYVIKM